MAQLTTEHLIEEHPIPGAYYFAHFAAEAKYNVDAAYAELINDYRFMDRNNRTMRSRGHWLNSDKYVRVYPSAPHMHPIYSYNGHQVMPIFALS